MASGDWQLATEQDRRAWLEALLERMVGPVRIGGFEALPGVSHRSWRVETERGVFAVKVRAAGAAVVLGVAAEHDVQVRAAAAGIAPEPVGFDADAGVIVSRFVDESAALTAAQVRESARIRHVVALLDALHALPLHGVGAFTAEAHARRYVDTAGRAGRLADGDQALAAELVALGAALDALEGGAVLCHTDLVASNVLASPDRLWLIDFEYAALADPVLDLASLAAMNGLDAEQCRELLAAYAERTARPWARAEFDKVVRLLRLLAYFWAHAEAERTGSRGELDEYRQRRALLTDRSEQ